MPKLAFDHQLRCLSPTFTMLATYRMTQNVTTTRNTIAEVHSRQTGIQSLATSSQFLTFNTVIYNNAMSVFVAGHDTLSL